MPHAHLSDALRSLWISDDATSRRRTLARLAQHKRQFESWWKCELAAHLWDYCDGFGPNTYVWLESMDRADITIATGVASPRGLLIAPECRVGIPLELKTSGTWWGATNSAIAKALKNGKKRLAADLRDLRDSRRFIKPFGVVGLLLTHEGSAVDPVFLKYLEYARALGHDLSLEVLLDEEIGLPVEDDQTVAAQQIFWIARAKIGASAQSS